MTVNRGEHAVYLGVEKLRAAMRHSHRHRLLAVPTRFPSPRIDVLKDVGVEGLKVRKVEVADNQVGMFFELCDA